MLRINFSNIQTVCVLYLISWLIAPPLSYDIIFRLVSVVAVVIWFFLQKFVPRIIDADTRSRSCLHTYLCFAVIYCCYKAFTAFFFDRLSIVEVLYDNINTYIMLLMGYIASTYIIEKRDEKMKLFFHYIIILTVIFSITSIFRSNEFQEFTRSAGGESDLEYTILARRAAMQGVGTFGFFCVTSVFAPILMWLSRNITGKNKRYYFIAACFLEVGVFSAGYTIALLISVVGLLIVALTSDMSAIIKVIVFLVGIFTVIYYETILQGVYYLLSSLLRGTFYENKVNDIFAFLLDGEEGGSFELRSVRYELSLKSIYKYPFVGSYLWEGTNAIGWHSSILDSFAAYGWILGYFWTYIVTIFPSKLASNVRKNTAYSLLGFAIIFLTALFNSMSMHIGIFYFIIPGAMLLAMRDYSIADGS